MKFPNKAWAEGFALQAGFAQEREGVIAPTLATHTFAMVEIGEHRIPTGKTIATQMGEAPEMVGDGFYWVLFRDLADRVLDPQLAPLLVWSSDMTHEVDGKAVPLPRPTTSDIPQTSWA